MVGLGRKLLLFACYHQIDISYGSVWREAILGDEEVDTLW